MNAVGSKMKKTETAKEDEEVVVFKAYSRVCFIVFVGIILSIVLFLMVLTQNLRTRENDFHHKMETQTLSLRHRIEVLEQFWKDIQSFYISSHEVEFGEFRSFSQSLIGRDEVLLIGQIPVNVQSLSAGDIFLTSRASKDEKQFKDFLESDPFIRKVTQKVRASRTVEIGSVSLPFLKNGEGRTVIVSAVPVIKREQKTEHLTNIILTFLDADLLLDTAFKDTRQDANTSVYLTDTTGDSRQLIFEHYSDPDVSSSIEDKLEEVRSGFSMSLNIPFGTRFLEIVSQPSFDYMGKSANWSPWLALFSGLSLTGLTALWFYEQISRNLAIRKIVREKTRALSISEQRVRSIFNHALDAIITISEKGEIIEWNRQAEEVFGWSDQEAIGKNMADLIIPPPYRDRHHKGMQKFLANGTSNILNRRIELEALRRDGLAFPVELSVTEHRSDGHYNFTAFISDITERKQAEEALKDSENKMRTIVDNTVDGLITINEKGKIETFNKACEDMFGYSVKEVIGKNIKILMPEPYHSEHDGYLSHYYKTGEKKIIGIGREVEARRKDGTVFPIDLSVSEVTVKGRRLYSGIIRDITERKLAETRLLEYTDKLRRSNQELDDFAYITSHDLKEPLRGLHNFSRFLIEDYEDRLDEEGKNMLHTIADLTKRMDAQLSSLLHYSRLERTELSVRKTDLNELVNNTIAMHDIQIKESGVEIKIERPLPEVVCDYVRIAEAFQNLIGNSLKYNDSADKEIEIGYREDDPDHPGEIVYFVKDNGIGIDEKNLDNIFKIFRRLHAQDAYGGGTGSGLTITKRIITRHGGKIWAESPGKGQGTTFYFTIPPQQETPV